VFSFSNPILYIFLLLLQKKYLHWYIRGDGSRLLTTSIKNMGRGRNGPVDQSQSKPKIRKDKEKEAVEPQWRRFDVPNSCKK